MWEILDTGIGSASKNMEIDRDLLERLSTYKDPILHFYDWDKNAATYGYFIDPKKFFSEEGLKTLSLGRRSTGGGVVFHIWDLAFSALVPSSHPLFSDNPLENYALINQAVLSAAKEVLPTGAYATLTPDDAKVASPLFSSFCMARPTKYDVVLGGKKIAGAAQRKTRSGFLHQGTIALCMPDLDYIKKMLKEGAILAKAMSEVTFPLLGETLSKNELKEGRETLKRLLRKHLTK